MPVINITIKRLVHCADAIENNREDRLRRHVLKSGLCVLALSADSEDNEDPHRDCLFIPKLAMDANNESSPVSYTSRIITAY